MLRNRRIAGAKPGMVGSLFVLLLAALIIAGCGGGSSSTGGSSSEAGGSTESNGKETTGSETGESSANGVDVAQVEEKLAPFLKPPKKIPLLTEPLKKLPTGKTVEYLECSALPCKVIGESLKKAATILGMQFKSINSGATPETFQAAAQQAVEDKPDVVMMAAIDAAIIKKQLEEMHEEGIITSAWATDTPPPGLIDVFVLRPKEWYEAGAALARYTILNSEGEANVIYFNQSVFTFAPVFGEGFQKTLEAECPNCKFKETDTLPEENGTKLPTKVVSELQADPSLDWVLFAYGAMNVGVPQALQAAELSEQANLISQEAQSNNLEYLKAGQEKANNNIDLEIEPGFYAVDGVARLLAGQKLPDYEKLNVHWFISPEEIEEVEPKEGYNPIPDFQSQFEELWGVK